MLQVAARNSGIKHKALLMSPTPPTDTIIKPNLSDESSLFPGDPFDRMCMDPELIRTRMQFMTGVGSVVALVMLALVMHWTHLWPQGNLTTTVDTPPAPLPAAEKSLPPTPKLHPANSEPDEADDTIKRLTFRPAKPSEGQPPVPTDEPLTVLERFLVATSVDEKLSLVADPAKVELTFRNYYQTHSVGSVPYSHIERHHQSPANFTEFRIVMRDGTRKFAAVLNTSVGPRVDWPSFVALGDLEWEQMLRSRPTKPVLMRVLATPAQQHTGLFSNAKKLRSVRLTSAANPSARPVFGYIPVETDLARQLDTWLGQEATSGVPLTLKVCYPSQSTSYDQVWITEVVVPGWVTVATHASSEGE